MREFYDTYMQFGTNSSRVGKVRWYRAAPGAKDLGFPTPFVSRNWDQWEIWPEVGEVQWAPRVRNDGSFPIVVPGTGDPCGSPSVWARGTTGTPHPIYPRNQFGIAACCGGLLALAGEPTFGLQVQIGFSVSPVVPALTMGRELLREEEQFTAALALTLMRKPAYPPDLVLRLREVEEIDESFPGQELIFGRE